MSGKRKVAWRLAMAGLALGIVLVVAALAALIVLSGPGASIPADGALFTVRQGANAAEISSELRNSGYIRSATVFRLYVRLGGKAGGLKAGTYKIDPTMGAREVLALLESGKQAMVRVTIPEGYTIRQTALLLESQGIMPAADFVKAASSPTLLRQAGIEAPSMEGYLFPDTYFLPVHLSAEGTVELMYGTFRKKVAEAFPESANLGPGELQKRLVLASVVEREYRLAEEAPLMASVFYNRLKIGMALQSCATVVYVITERQGKPHPDVIYDRDLKIADPYNTYAQRGLPPGPICSPGMTALSAAFRPATSRYLYFRLVDADQGKHHFSVSLEEHNEAAALIVKKVGK